MLANTPHNPACKKEYTIAVASVFHSFDERLLQGDPWMHNKIYKQKHKKHTIQSCKIKYASTKQSTMQNTNKTNATKQKKQASELNHTLPRQNTEKKRASAKKNTHHCSSQCFPLFC